MRVHPLRGPCSQPHFPGPSRIFRGPDTETDTNISRHRPGNRHTDTRGNTGPPPQGRASRVWRRVGGKGLKICGSGL